MYKITILASLLLVTLGLSGQSLDAQIEALESQIDDLERQQEALAEQVETVDIIEGGTTAAAGCIFLLISSLDQMHMHWRIVFFGRLGEPLQGFVRAPVQIGRSKLDADPVFVMMLLMQALEHRHEVIEIHAEA